MAVQQNKKSPSRRDMRRAQKSVSPPTLATDARSGERHRRHHLSANGYYRGRQIIEEAPAPAAGEDAPAAGE